MKINDMSKELRIVGELFRKAGAMLLEMKRKSLNVKLESDGPHSNADKTISKFLRKKLSKEFPQYGILEEETAKTQDPRKKYKIFWVLDPLDNTRGYIEGNKGDNNFGIIGGLVVDDTLMFTAAYRPALDEFAYAIKGKGAFIEHSLENRRIWVSQSTNIEVLISPSRGKEQLTQMLEAIKPKKTITMGGSLKALEIAKGNATLFLCPPQAYMYLCDLVPTLIVQEAGGKYSDVFGNPTINWRGEFIHRNGIVASNRIIHDKVIDNFRSLSLKPYEGN